jgi:hypothetical protein
MSEEDPEVEREPKKPSKRGRLFKKLKGWWSQITFVATIVGAFAAGTIWVDDRLDEFEQRGVDIGELKESNAALRNDQDTINERITKNVNDATKQITEEFELRDHVDAELRANVLAVLTEMRARHGVIPLAGGGAPQRRVAVQEAQEASDHATIRSGNALPQADPLSTLEGL